MCKGGSGMSKVEGPAEEESEGGREGGINRQRDEDLGLGEDGHG